MLNISLKKIFTPKNLHQFDEICRWFFFSFLEVEGSSTNPFEEPAPLSTNPFDEEPTTSKSVSIPPSPRMRIRGSSIDGISVESVDSNEDSVGGDKKPSGKHCTVFEKDAYNVFRSLCKLSMKPFKEAADSR